jgi:hypothetical protein
MNKLLRKDYELEISIWNKKKVFMYQQATAYETLEFIELASKENFNVLEWVYDFLNNVCKVKKIPFTNNISRKEYMKYVKNFDKIFRVIKDTYFKWAFGKEETEQETLFESYIAFMSKELNIDPLRLLKEYTFEQLTTISDGVIYNINMQTEEGQKANKKIMNKRKIEKQDPEELKKAFDKLLNK